MIPQIIAARSFAGHLQAWVHVSAQPLPPEVASAISRELARLYHGDPASTDWRHLGRLPGFTNQKPQRRLPNGLAPWVKLVYAKPGLAVSGGSLRHSAAPCALAGVRSQKSGVRMPKPAVSRLGDLWLCGSHRVLCGDATSGPAVARLLGERRVRLLVTELPEGVRSLNGAFALAPGVEAAYVWHDSRFTREVLDGLLRVGFEDYQQIIWDRGAQTAPLGQAF